MLPKLISTEQLALLPRASKRLVFTNGCFDLLHPGHLHLIREAKKLGDILVVGLNSDTSVKRLKGESRPIEQEAVRALHLAELPEVDHVLIFPEDNPLALIEALKPDVLVKGGDYTEDRIVGAGLVKSNGGQVVIIPLLGGYSTSGQLSSKP